MKAAGQTLPRPPALNRIVGYVCQRIEIKEKELAVPGKGREAARARALIGWLAMRTGAAPLTEVARRFNRNLSTLSRAVGALQRIASAGGPVCVSAQTFYGSCQVPGFCASSSLAQTLPGDVGQMVILIIGSAIPPHHKDDL